MLEKKKPHKFLHILLAEDNICDQVLMLRLLKYMGLRADLTGNGLEVLDALKIRSYDVILMDIQMPRWMARRRPESLDNVGMIEYAQYREAYLRY